MLSSIEMWVIISLHNFLSSMNLGIICLVAILLTPCSDALGRFIAFFPMSFLHSFVCQILQANSSHYVSQKFEMSLSIYLGQWMRKADYQNLTVTAYTEGKKKYFLVNQIMYPCYSQYLQVELFLCYITTPQRIKG